MTEIRKAEVGADLHALTTRSLEIGFGSGSYRTVDEPVREAVPPLI